jgi:hypothetical protein
LITNGSFFILCYVGMAKPASAAEAPAPQAVVEYILLGLFGERICREHRSYLSTIFSTTLGTVCAQTLGHYMPLDDCWVPKYVIRYLTNVNMNYIIFQCIFHHTNILWSMLRAGLPPGVSAVAAPRVA